jgi:hypothetical protein
LSLWKLSRYNLTASRALFPHRAKVRIISTYSEEEYMLNDTLELNIAAKFYNKCQTDVNNYSNKCSGPNQMDRIKRKPRQRKIAIIPP